MIKCNIIADMLQAAFAGSVTEQDYHLIVKCLREYSVNRDTREVEREVFASRGWLKDYDPCTHMENIRFGLHFDNRSPSNPGVMSAVNTWNTLLQNNNY